MNASPLVVMLCIACAAGCAEQKASPEPQTSPQGVELENRDRDEAMDGKSEDTERPASDSKESTAEEDGPSKEKEESDSPSIKKSCTGLKKGECQVTVGCAWSTDKVCVNQ